ADSGTTRRYERPRRLRRRPPLRRRGAPVGPPRRARALRPPAPRPGDPGGAVAPPLPHERADRRALVAGRRPSGAPPAGHPPVPRRPRGALPALPEPWLLQVDLHPHAGGLPRRPRRWRAARVRALHAPLGLRLPLRPPRPAAERLGDRLPPPRWGGPARLAWGGRVADRSAAGARR